jgi:hypothetical protein
VQYHPLHPFHFLPFPNRAPSELQKPDAQARHAEESEMRPATSVLTATLFMSLLLGPPLAAQSPDPPAKEAKKKRVSRPGAKPGEIITPPDLSERWRDQLQVDSAAPDFTLTLLPPAQDAAARPDGQPASRTVTLTELRANRPAVLIFGSMTCPPFRGQLAGVDQVYQRYKDRAEFLFVYVREAHPDSVLSVLDRDGHETLVKIPQAADLTGRTESAAACQRTERLKMPVAVDTLDNRVGKAYAGWPNRMVVVGTDGKIVYASPAAPRGTNAQQLHTWLDENLPR